jgi:hypothetical protein
MSEQLLDRAGRRRSPTTMPGFHAGRPPRKAALPSYVPLDVVGHCCETGGRISSPHGS